MKTQSVFSKPVLIFAIYLTAVCSVIAQDKSDKEKEHLLGPVKVVSSKMLDYADGKSQKPFRTVIEDIVNYDSNGRETERTIYSDYGELIGKKVNKYNETGKISESILSDAKNIVQEKITFEFDHDNLVKINTFNGKEQLRLIQTNLFNDENYLATEIYSVSSKMFGKTVYQYDNNHNLIETAFFDSDGIEATASVGPCFALHKLIRSYSGRNITQIVAYEQDGKIKKTWKYSYDLTGRVTEIIQESKYSTVKTQYTYKNDSKGNWIKRTNNSSTLTKPVPSKSKIFDTPDLFRHVSVTLREVSYY